MKLELRKLKWWQWILVIAMLPMIATVWVWQKKDWSQSKRLRFIAGMWVIFIAFAAYQEFKPVQQPTEIATSNISTPQAKEEQKQENQPFSEEDALQKVKTYEFESTIKGVSKTRSLQSYFSELETLGIANNGSWKINSASGIENAYYAVYTYQAYGDYKNPKWLVSKDALQAVDDESKLITANLVPSEHNKKDELIYDSFNANLGKLMDTKPSSTTAQIDAIYEEAYWLTAKEYKITSGEVKQAIARAQKANTVR